MRKFILSALIALLSIPQMVQAAETTETYDYALAKLKSNPNNYVWLQETSVENLDFANMVLCIIKNTGADLADQINKGPYVATVTKNGCDKNSTPSTSSADGSGATAATLYEYFVINATSDGVNLDVKLWVPYNSETDDDEIKKEIRARFIFPLVRAGSDIGFSELYFKGLQVNDDGSTSNNTFMYGFMKPEAITNGYKLLYGERFTRGVQSIDVWMNLTRTGTGPGVNLTGWTKSYPTSQDINSAPVFAVAANQNELLRQQTVNGISTAPICFDRTKSKFNTWNYNLYDASTGLLVGGNSTFQIRYGDYRGNYWANGMWLPDAAMEDIYAKKSVDILIEDGGNTKIGTVTVSNGGFRKVKKVETALKDIADMTFNVWTGDKEERVFWNKSNARFELDDKDQNPMDTKALEDKNWDTIWLNGPGVSYMLKAKTKEKPAPWDQNQKISAPDWSALNNESVAISRMESQVSEAELNSLDGKTLNCLSNCPFWNPNSNEIQGVNAWDKTKPVNNTSVNGSSYESGKGYQYVYDHAQRKLFNTHTSYSQIPLEINGDLETKWSQDNNFPSIFTGALVLNDTNSLDDMITKAQCTWNNNYICGWDYENTVSEYYYWRSGPYSWDKQWTVKINGVVPEMPEQLMVRYTCPDGRGCTKDSKIVLNYNGAGQLWGIPNRCVSSDDSDVEVDCNQSNIQWFNKFNLTASPVNASKATDKATKLGDSSKEYWILPQGSAEWYEKKKDSSGNLAACNLTLPTGTAQPVNVDDYYKANMTDIGTPPLNYKTTPVSVQNGVKLR